MTAYAGYLRRLSRINPVDYQDAGTQAHLAALAVPLDELTARARAVMLARLILHAPEGALMLLGAERRLRRFPREPLAIYRRRVLGAWIYWMQAGTLPGMVLVLDQAGYKATVTEHFRDPDPVRWAEFSIHLVPARPTPAGNWDEGGIWDEDEYWDLNPNAVPLESVLDLVREVKPAHARLRRLTYSPNEEVWDGDANWGGTETTAVSNLYGKRFGSPQQQTTTTETGDIDWDGNELVVIYDLRPELGPKE